MWLSKIFKDETRCYNGGLRHNYEVIYDEKSSPMEGVTCEGRGFSPKDVAEAFSTKEKTYKKTICKWCGKIIDEDIR